MSTRSAKRRLPGHSAGAGSSSTSADAVEVRLKGPGVTTLGLVDGRGNVLLSRRVMVSGPDALELKFQMPLGLSTTRGEVAAVATLFHQTSAQQRVMIGGKDPATAAAERQRALNLDRNAIAKLKAACDAAAAQIGKTGRLTVAKPSRSRAR